ncbi:MAG: hypothetical protein ABGX05_07315 [Pirellulaceae bacterium]
MEPFNPAQYGVALAAILDPSRPVAIGPGKPAAEQEPLLRELTIEKAFAGQDLQDADAAACCISAAWLWHNFLDSSHQISQEIKTSSGSFWHAIMHRREEDFSNAKYWFRQVDGHEVYALVAEAAEPILSHYENPTGIRPLAEDGSWDPFAFVDLCQQVGETDGSLLVLCQELTRLEWQLLFDYCFHQACPG